MAGVSGTIFDSLRPSTLILRALSPPHKNVDTSHHSSVIFGIALPSDTPADGFKHELGSVEVVSD